MNRTELNKHDKLFRKHLSTFRATSKAKPAEGDPEGVYCIAEGKKIEAVDFDAVQREWSQIGGSEPKHMPCSVDAVYFSDGHLFAVEFKSGVNVSEANLVRKIYDTAISLISHDGKNPDYCKSHVEYVVVAQPKDDVRSRVTMRTSGYMEAPWDVHAWDRWGLYRLEGVIVAKTYVLPPDMFYRFAKNMRWTD